MKSKKDVLPLHHNLSTMELLQTDLKDSFTFLFH